MSKKGSIKIMSKPASSFATGAGGAVFETRVQAAFIATMLVNGQYPCIPYGKADSIRLQARQAGYETDDLLLVLTTLTNQQHKLLAQMKHTITVSENDSEFEKVIKSFWADFVNEDLFNPNNDVLVLITGPLSASYINHVMPVLDWARHSRDANEFLNKLNTSGFSSDLKRKYSQIIRILLDKANEAEITDEQFWRFCYSLNIVSYDFSQSSSKDTANILSMLQLAKDPSSSEPAQGIWSQVITYAQEANQNAATITCDKIPARIKEWVKGGFEIVNTQSLKRLKEHGDTILNIIDDKIAQNVSFERASITDDIFDLLNDSNFVLITGISGIGKSVIAKKVANALRGRFPIFIFKTEEFDHPHLHQMLTSVGVQDTITDLSSRFALLTQKILFIESLEKIFELRHRDAFKQLLDMLKSDPSWKIVVTCRWHAIDWVKQEFLFPFSIKAQVCTIPKLSDKEIEYIRTKIPSLSPFFDNSRIRDFLRVPGHLKYACQVLGNVREKAESIDEEKLRQVIWDNVIEKKTDQRKGLPLKRKSCFIDICLRRAKSMSVTVPMGECDEEALQQLVRDNVLREVLGGYLPEQDLLEDWALIRYINDAFTECSDNPPTFFSSIGEEPAMRRSFRMWLVEMLEKPESTVFNDFITASLKNESLSQYWRDGIIIAVLSSDRAENYISQQKNKLLENDAALLIRMIHLLRVGCKFPDEKMLETLGLTEYGRKFMSLMFLKPKGSGWASIIKFVHANINKIDFRHSKLILGMLKDWCSTIKVGEETLKAGRETGLIALYFWNKIKEFYNDEFQKEVLKVILHVPRELKAEISALVDEALAYETFKVPHHLRTFLHLIIGTFDNIYICQHLPEIVIRVAEHQWLLLHSQRKDERYSDDIEQYFDLNHNYDLKYFPASALQGPFFTLLQYHPEIGLNLILKLVNHATEGYINSTLDKDSANEPVKVKVILNDAPATEQWGSERLWSLYRGTHVGPHVLVSALMALESWLLRLAESNKDISNYFDKLLKETNSVAVTSILVSLALAYPQTLKERCLPLLRTKEFFHWDLIRQHRDMSHIGDLRATLGIPTGGMDDVHYNERKELDKKKHRKYNLESLALNLQFAQLKDEVQKIIDEYHHQLPPVKQQSELDKTWRIALKRMDLREYKVEAPKDSEYIMFVPTEPEEDIKEFQEKAKPGMEAFGERSALSSWGMNKFENKPPSSTPFEDWKKALAAAQKIHNELQKKRNEQELLMHQGGPVYVAAVCIRDHSNELTDKQKKWCMNVLLEAVREEMDSLDSQVRVSRFAMHGSRPAAMVLPLLLDLVDKRQKQEVKRVIAGSFTHASEEVREYAIAGAHNYLWKNDPTFAHSCLVGMLHYASLCERRYKIMYRREPKQLAQLMKEKQIIRQKMTAGYDSNTVKISDITFENYSSYDLGFAISMIPQNKTEDFYIRIFEQILKELITEATEHEQNHSRRDVNHRFRHHFARLFSRFVLQLPKEKSLEIVSPLFGAIDTCPEFATDVFAEFVYAEDATRSGETFWEIWNKTSKMVFNKPEITQKGTYGHHQYSKMVRVLLFADVYWKKEATEWEPLTGHREFIENACKLVGHLPIGFMCIAKLFNSVGQVFLPGGFVWLNEALLRAKDQNVFSETNTTYYMELILQKTIYKDGTTIRSERTLKSSIMNLLDALVNEGSSIAFHLREAIVAPMPSTY